MFCDARQTTWRNTSVGCDRDSKRLSLGVVQIGVSLHLQNSTNKFQKLERKSEGHERLIHLVINCIAIKI